MVVFVGQADAKTYGMLFNLHRTDILNFAQSIMANRADAEDIAQEVFIHSYIHLRAYDPSRSLKKWLITIAYRSCLDQMRKRRTEKKYMRKWALEFMPANRTGPEIEKVIDEFSFVRKNYKLLTLRERTAFHYLAYEGWNAVELAGIMNCAVDTVRVFLFNAKRKLRRCIR